MSESLYTVKQLGQNSEKVDDLTCVFDLQPVCRPRAIMKSHHQVSSSGTESGTSGDMTLSDHSIFVDSDISDELRLKVKLCVFQQAPQSFFFLESL